MKTKICLLSTVSMLFFIRCTEIPDESYEGLIDNSEKIQKVIEGFDVSLKEYISSDLKLSDEELSDFFIKELVNLNTEILEIGQTSPNLRSIPNNLQLSNEYYDMSATIRNTNLHSTNQAYQNSIISLEELVKFSNLALHEKQILIDNIRFMDSFVNWMQHTETAYGTYSSSCTGWWSCWGKCAAGAIGSGITGGIGGCATGGMVGGAVGTVVPGVGNAVGIISGCVAVGVIGIVGGGLVGAATFCN